MTVADLIDRLAEMPRDAAVSVAFEAHCCGGDQPTVYLRRDGVVEIDADGCCTEDRS